MLEEAGKLIAAILVPIVAKALLTNAFGCLLNPPGTSALEAVELGRQC